MLAIASFACGEHNEDRPVWKHPWVCVADTCDDSKRALWVWVNGVLLDSSNEALVLDCCIMPVNGIGDASTVLVMPPPRSLVQQSPAAATAEHRVLRSSRYCQPFCSHYK